MSVLHVWCMYVMRGYHKRLYCIVNVASVIIQRAPTTTAATVGKISYLMDNGHTYGGYGGSPDVEVEEGKMHQYQHTAQ